MQIDGWLFVNGVLLLVHPADDKGVIPVQVIAAGDAAVDVQRKTTIDAPAADPDHDRG